MNRLPSFFWARLNLAARLSLTVTLITILVAIGVAYVSSRYLVQQAQAELIADHAQHMDILESVVLTAVVADGSKGGRTFDVERLVGVLDKLNFGPDVTQAGFRDTSEVAAYNRDITIELDAPLFFARWCGLETVSLNRPLTVEGEYYGLLSLTLSPHRIINETWANYRNQLLMEAISLAAILFSIWVVLRQALRPLLTLVEATRTFAEGDLSVRVPAAGSPELRTVLRAFNQMTASVQSTQAALQASEHEFRSLAEAVPQIVWVARPDGWHTYFNQQWVDYTGLTLDESHGHGWIKPFHVDDEQRAWDAWQNATHNGASYSVECRLRRADGAYRWWLIRGVPLRDASGKVLKWFGTCTDIEDIKQAESALRQKAEALRASNAELEQFNRAMVGRELRMIELKQDINDLCQRLGEPPRHGH